MDFDRNAQATCPAPLLLSALTAIVALSLATALLFWDAAPEFYTRISLLMAALFGGLSITLLSLLVGQILPYIAPLPSELLLVFWLFAITLLLLTAQQIAVALNRPGLIAPADCQAEAGSFRLA